MSSTVVELWGGLHDGKRMAVRAGSKAELPPTLHFNERMPVQVKEGDTSPTPNAVLRVLRYTYTLDRKAKRNLYRYTSCEEVKP